MKVSVFFLALRLVSYRHIVYCLSYLPSTYLHYLPLLFTFTTLPACTFLGCDSCNLSGVPHCRTQNSLVFNPHQDSALLLVCLPNNMRARLETQTLHPGKGGGDHKRTPAKDSTPREDCTTTLAADHCKLRLSLCIPKRAAPECGIGNSRATCPRTQ
jgi:hypothetical protein